jgi:hypothetical protein
MYGQQSQQSQQIRAGGGRWAARPSKGRGRGDGAQCSDGHFGGTTRLDRGEMPGLGSLEDRRGSALTSALCFALAFVASSPLAAGLRWRKASHLCSTTILEHSQKHTLFPTFRPPPPPPSLASRPTASPRRTRRHTPACARRTSTWSRCNRHSKKVTTLHAHAHSPNAGPRRSINSP